MSDPHAVPAWPEPSPPCRRFGLKEHTILPLHAAPVRAIEMAEDFQPQVAPKPDRAGTDQPADVRIRKFAMVKHISA
jgi:hypothetical protein